MLIWQVLLPAIHDPDWDAPLPLGKFHVDPASPWPSARGTVHQLHQTRIWIEGRIWTGVPIHREDMPGMNRDREVSAHPFS